MNTGIRLSKLEKRDRRAQNNRAAEIQALACFNTMANALGVSPLKKLSIAGMTAGIAADLRNRRAAARQGETREYQQEDPRAGEPRRTSAGSF